MRTTRKEYKTLFDEDQAVGWLEIDKKLTEVYGDQKPRHYAPELHYVMGGTDPLDGISIYDCQDQEFHRHFVSYGMSELYYNEEAVGGEFSKWGFEFTFRLKPFAEDGDDPLWVMEVMNKLARYVFETNNSFDDGHFIPANAPIRTETNEPISIEGLLFVVDPILGTIDTPHGKVTFLQLVGITTDELNVLKKNPTDDQIQKLIEDISSLNPLMVTDLIR